MEEMTFFLCEYEYDIHWHSFKRIADIYDGEEGKAKKVVQAQNLWFDILKSQIETGTPYMLYKILATKKATSKILVLLSLIEISIQAQRKLRSAIWLQLLCHDLSGKRSIGIGVQGLADTFTLLGMAFYSPEVNYLDATLLLIWLQRKALYETYEGSPISKGTLQPDMWGVTPSNQWDWVVLRAIIEKNEVRNSLLVAPMPTASTSQILGNNECLEPYTSNIYSRSVLSGEFVVVNKHLLHDLTEMGLWSPLKNQIIYEDGFVPKIPEIPDELKLIYKTVWEIKQRTLVDMAADRGCYIDQSQSLNIHTDQPNFGKLTSIGVTTICFILHFGKLIPFYVK
nr:ribonucleoside-diphosphate reductase large subunit [Ipomoea batatas]